MIKQDTSNTTHAKVTLFIVMGVSGSGKTVLGQQLANDLNREAEFVFIDADDFHTDEAKKRMANNLPLDDLMRKPWIEAIIKKLNMLNKQHKSVVLAYSGLKKQHRDCFRALDFYCHYFYLSADINIIKSRMLTRTNHFFSADLLASQYKAMQAIDNNEQDVTTLDVSGSFDDVYNKVFTLAKSILR